MAHFAHGTAAHRACFRVIARRPCREMESDIFAEIGSRGQQPSRGTERSLWQWRFFREMFRPAAGGNLSRDGRRGAWENSKVEASMCSFARISLRTYSSYGNPKPGDDTAQQSKSVVGVFITRVRVALKTESPAQPLGQVGIAGA